MPEGNMTEGTGEKINRSQYDLTSKRDWKRHDLRERYQHFSIKILKST